MKDNEKSREQLTRELEKLRLEIYDLKNSNNVSKTGSSDLLYSPIMSSNDEWQLTFDAIPDLIALIDKDFRIIKMNKAMAELLGVNAQEIVGCTVIHWSMELASHLLSAPMPNFFKMNTPI